MNKVEMIKAIAERTGFTQKDVKVVMEAMQDVTFATVAHEEVKLMDGVTLTVAERAARTGRNPQTGETLEIPAKVTPKCKFGKAIKDVIEAEA